MGKGSREINREIQQLFTFYQTTNNILRSIKCYYLPKSKSEACEKSGQLAIPEHQA